MAFQSTLFVVPQNFHIFCQLKAFSNDATLAYNFLTDESILD